MSDSDTNFHWPTRNNIQNLVEGLEVLKIRGQVETLQTIARILRRVLNTWRDMQSLWFEKILKTY